jgi:hypothetical protein
MFALSDMVRGVGERRHSGAEARMRPGSAMRVAWLERDLADIEREFQLAGGDERMKKQAERAALMGAVKLEEMMADVINYRDAKGRSDPAKARMFLVEANAYQTPGGGKDVASHAKVIRGGWHSKIDQALWAWRKGATTGDLRRSMGQTQANLENTWREMWGEKTGDDLARTFAKAISEDVYEDFRQRFNAGGGDIGKLEGYSGPQYHDPDALRAVGREPWVSWWMNHIDRNRMIDYHTGRPMDDAAVQELLRETWRNITSDGTAKLDVGEVAPTKGALYKRYAEHRVLHLKSAADAIEYAKLYGGGDLYASLDGWMSKASRDLAMIERFGPNPDLNWRRLGAFVEQEVANSQIPVPSMVDDLERRINAFEMASGADLRLPMAELKGSATRLDDLLDADRNRIRKRHRDEIATLQNEVFAAARSIDDAMTLASRDPQHLPLAEAVRTILNEIVSIDGYSAMQTVTGAARLLPWNLTRWNPQSRMNYLNKRADDMFELAKGTTNVPVHQGLANTMSAFRSWQSASSLVFAPFSAVGDQATQSAARIIAGLPVTRQLWSMVKAFTPEDRQLALHLGFSLDAVHAAFAQTARMTNESNARGWSGYIADRSHALSFLAPLTSAQKVAFQLDFVKHMGSLANTSYARLPEPVRLMFERHGISANDWDLMRSSPLEGVRGTEALTRHGIEATVGEDLAEKYMMMIEREGSGSTIGPSLRTRTLWIGDTRPGTPTGDFWRSAGLLKSYSTAYSIDVIGRFYHELMAGRGLRPSVMGYGTAIFVGGTLLGALSIQMKHVLHGRQPEDMTKPAFWAKAFMQSGGAGIMGDFIGSSVSRHQTDLGQTVMGPVFSNIFFPLLGLTAGNVGQYARDEKTNIGREAVNILRKNTPGAFVPWYLRTTYERMILDEVQKQVDPDHWRNFSAQERRWRRQTNQDFWWPPGRPAPTSEVDLSRAIPR